MVAIISNLSQNYNFFAYLRKKVAKKFGGFKKNT